MRYLLRDDAMKFSRYSGAAWIAFIFTFGLAQTPSSLFGFTDAIRETVSHLSTLSLGAAVLATFATGLVVAFSKASPNYY